VRESSLAGREKIKEEMKERYKANGRKKQEKER
jgi:hypothetical protein